jgi:ATP-dependent Clp protease ATP-binding subunit ClpB
LEANGEVVEFLIRHGYHKTLGARPMRSVVERHLQDAIAEGMLSNGSGSGRVVVDRLNERLVLHPSASGN